MSPAEAGAKVQQLVAMLFGKTGARSPLWVSDAIACRLGPPHPQIFNAADRFTGGVQDTKLYHVQAVAPGPLTAELHLERKREPAGDWWKGLLILVLRDALEGDLAVGWGKARGFGVIKIALEWDGTRIDSWPAFLGYLDNANLRPKVQGWIEALHGEVEKLANRGGR